MSDSEDDSPRKPLPVCDDNDKSDLVNDDLCPIVRPSPKLAVMDQSRNHQNIHNKFSIWSEILMEEQLTDSLDKSLKIKNKRRKKFQRKKTESTSDAENYFSWTNKDFEKKFAKKTKDNNKKDNVILEISHKLKESRTDIIKKVVEVLGEPKTRQLVVEVLDIEDAGGIMTNNNERRRSPGGVLFYLIKNDSTISDSDKQLIFCDNAVKQRNRKVKKMKRQRNKARSSQNDKKKKKRKRKKK